MNTLKLISFILLVSILNSCAILGTNSKSSKIVGHWEWIHSYGGFAGETTTPDSAGVPNRHFRFNSDHKFSFFRTDTLVQTGKYLLKEKDGEVVISYDTENENLFFDQRVRFQGNDTLILSDECYDCYINYYIRVQ